MSLAELIEQYGYPLLFLGTLLEGETFVLLSAFAAHRGYLDLGWVIAVATAGSFLADQTFIWIGRRFGAQFLARHPRLERGAARMRAVIARHPAASVLTVRFLYGLRIVGPIAIGMSPITRGRTVLLNLGGALLWAALLAGAGYLLGEALERALDDVKAIEERVLIAILAVGALAALAHALLKRRTAEVGAE